ncbi:SRPBCC family protein [Fulvivirga ulvae]|uniref:SRPBCC family protein n=1 Tax=Fulvivirga ulvae TaxID=2904245 RepID=UPI001F33DBFC|nr:SRPBCC family protein [Fulvivirga ulvae]UII34656.1 SRPBCC family protein [Fulvivirga ulvae]
MTTQAKTNITVEASISAPAEKVWKLWTTPEDIIQWNSPSEDWHTPSATNDLRVGGKFTSRMEAKDGSMGFDFAGIYDEVKTNELIRYTLEDDRKVSVLFKEENGKTQVTTTFEAEGENPIEMQRDGWQAILDNFKKYVEAKGK